MSDELEEMQPGAGEPPQTARPVCQCELCTKAADPSAPPLPPVGGWLAALARTVAAVSIASAGAVVVLGAWPRTTMGATVSARLEWERRQQLIDEAQRSVEADAPASASAEAHPNG